MPFESISAADATAHCPVETCAGHHQPWRASAPLVVRAWTRRVGNGPITIARTERQPVEVQEHQRHCPHCGTEATISAFKSPPHWAVIWPEPTVSPGFTQVDEDLPDPTPEPTDKERLAALERDVQNLKNRLR